MKRTLALFVLVAVWLVFPGAQRPQEPSAVPDELLVKFQPQATESRRALALARRNARVLRRFDAIGLQHVGLPRGVNLQAELVALQADPDVELVQPNYVRRTTAVAPPNDPFWSDNSLWGLAKIQADTVWASYTTGSASIVLAAIDTGVNYDHQDLAANIWTNPGEIAGNGIDDDSDGYIDDVHGINVLTHSGNPMDDHGHGTHTAGTMAGVGNNGVGVVGLNWNAKVLGCKFLNAQGSGSDAGAAECFNYIVLLKQRGVNIRVSNNSWGSTRGGSVPVALKAAIDAAGAVGILNVFAAGNGGANNVTTPFDPASLDSSSIISVAASDQGDARAGFSNYGTNVHLAAPGVGIISTYGFNYGSMSGTSMATPHVSGAAAIIASLSPSASPEAIKAVLINNVDTLPQWSGLVSSGGRLNVLKAVQSVVQAPPPAQQTLLTTQIPDGEYSDYGTTYELGLKLRSDVAGQITALRYWKASLENGAHIGRVWSAAGVVLATVTFAGESGSGWQQQALPTPLSILANTDYVVTVSTGANGYYVSSNGLAAVLTNAHLQTSGPNGGRYGPLGSFPATSSHGNYFRDIVFVPGSAPPDPTPPTVSITQPGAGATVSGTAVTLAATASDNVAVVGVQFQVDGGAVGAEQTSAPYSVPWNSTTVANGPHTVTAIARDGAGNTTPASIGITVNNAAQPPPAQQTLLTTQIPDGEYSDYGTTYELGLKLRSDVAGQITALRYWKASLENGAHIGRVWSAAGVVLATVTFAGESGSGWQQQALPTPLSILANTDYVVTVSTGANGYYVSSNGLAAVLTNAHLQTSGPNGGRYGPLGSFPATSSHGNYFRDIVFVPGSAPPDPTPPTVSITQPGAGATVSGTAVTLAATASDNVAVVGVQFQVDGGAVGAEQTSAPYSVPWNSTTVANGPHTVTAIARDGAGNTTPASIGITVNNAAQPPPAQQTLLTTQIPDGEYSDYGTTYELGLKLRSDVAGQITALRYWKASLENGAHIGRVWSAAGVVLATVTFAGESGSGWQQQALPTPLSILANTDYVVTVSTGANGYYVSSNGLAAVLTNAHLQTSGPNGGRYGPLGSFPATSSHGNYFRDIVFVPGSAPPDPTPPTVSITQPGAGATVSGTAVTLAATASDNVAVVGVQFQVDGGAVGAEQTSAPYSVPWNSTTVANGPHTVTAIARDGAGNTTPASIGITVNNAAQPPPAQQTLLTTQIPDGEYSDYGTTYELGLKLRSDVAGQITALRYWKASLENGAHIGRVWSAAGVVLATVTFAGESGSGWQQQALPTPLSILANTDYVVTVSTGANGYYVSSNGLAAVLTNAHLQTSGPNGGRYGPLGSFPATSSHGNYFRDIVFVPDGGSPVLTPNPVSPSDLDVRIDLVGQMTTHTNPTSPAVVGSQLLLVDQAGYISRWDGASSHDVLTPSTFPPGIFPPGGESVLNVAANQAGSILYVMFSTFTAPTGIPISISPRPSDSWQVLYRYNFNGTVVSNPTPIRAFQVRSDGHTGGGLAVLADGSLLCSIGDNGDAGEDGRAFAQDPTNHLSKILRIDPTNGATTVVALGVRNVQRIALYPSGSDFRVDFADLGGSVAEEMNSILTSDLLGGSPRNFGWGRNSGDSTAREGTLYIDFGGAAVGAAPTPEAGFQQPVAQFGREGAALIAVSGPVSSTQSFTRLTSLFGDLVSGSVYGVTGSLSLTGQTVFRVNLLDSNMQPTTLAALAGGRPDVRFFNFPDGTAGVLLERTGSFYRLTEVR